MVHNISIDLRVVGQHPSYSIHASNASCKRMVSTLSGFVLFFVARDSSAHNRDSDALIAFLIDVSIFFFIEFRYFLATVFGNSRGCWNYTERAGY